MAGVLTVVGVAAAALGKSRAWSGPVSATALLLAVASLGASLGPLYAPYRVMVWAHRYERVPALVDVTQRGLVVAAARGSRGLVVGRLSADGSSRRRRQTSTPSLRYDRDGHLLTVAPTRSGKGVGCVIPNLLTYDGSVVVTDPKGENFAVTARQRRAMGQAVYVLDPFEAVRDAPAFTGSDQSFWDEEARALLTGVMLHVASAAPRELRTLPGRLGRAESHAFPR